MNTVFDVLHVVSAVFIVGPMAILPMSALRSLRAGNASEVSVLAKSTKVFSLLSLIVLIFGFGLMGLSDHQLTFTTPWILFSVIFYVVALALSLLMVVPAMGRASAQLGASSSPGATTAGSKSEYGAVAAGSGVVSLLLVLVVVLMVWKP